MRVVPYLTRVHDPPKSPVAGRCPAGLDSTGLSRGVVVLNDTAHDPNGIRTRPDAAERVGGHGLAIQNGPRFAAEHIPVLRHYALSKVSPSLDQERRPCRVGVHKALNA